MMPLLDALLAAGLVGVALLTLTARDSFVAIVLFIATGLLIALAWARLGAADVAIAEAAIGAGMTGALLLAAWRRLRSGSHGKTSGAEPPAPRQGGPDRGH